ncbi:Fungal specific transcription factor domain [Rhizoctonia solani]|uniref:Fungal specific transcription factor domain n=1 Tax=Rhizoctonia solani TaxID=456999 RepID=A0A8H7LZA3_9AGAM|nr:Fungal specific transcription factor domain [Rhizoctonia solani]
MPKASDPTTTGPKPTPSLPTHSSATRPVDNVAAQNEMVCHLRSQRSTVMTSSQRCGPSLQGLSQDTRRRRWQSRQTGPPLDSIQPDCVYDGDDQEESPPHHYESTIRSQAQPSLFSPTSQPQPQAPNLNTTLPSLFDGATGLDTLFGDVNPAILQDNNTPVNLTDAYIPFEPNFGAEPSAMVPHSWPEELPEPYVLMHLTRTFFASHALAPHLLHRPTFLTRLALPPTHAAFPAPALLHAISAVGALYAPQPEEIEKIKRLRERLEAAGTSGTYPTRSAPKTGGPLDDMSFGDKHAALCFAKALDDARIGRRLLENVQALIVLAWWMGANAGGAKAGRSPG